MAKDIGFHFRGYDDRTFRYHLPHLVTILKYVKEPYLIVDIGSGLGLFLEACERNGITAIGLEGTFTAVKTCSEKGLNALYHYLHHPFPLKSEIADAVFCNQIMEHLNVITQTNVLRESYRILKPGGYLFIYSPCKFSKAEQDKEGHINLLTPTILKRKMLEVGFSQVDLSLNYPLPMNKVMAFVFRILFWIIGPIDRLSASAHAIGRKI
jgi:SAM-dependent methyltransferase